jgi:hypothetical protein
MVSGAASAPGSNPVVGRDLWNLLDFSDVALI